MVATAYKTEVQTQRSFYVKSEAVYDRNLKVYFSVPENEIREDTGLLLIITGYGKQADDEEYQAVRDKLADSENMVVVQCEYFGSAFMRKDNLGSVNVGKLLNLLPENEVFFDRVPELDVFLTIAARFAAELTVPAEPIETVENFNDCGPMQALDNIIAVLQVITILYNSQYVINTEKIIVCGQAHGGYLAYLCNRLAPGFFSMVIEQGAWLQPGLPQNRVIPIKKGNFQLNVVREYLGYQLINDDKILSLPFLYQNYTNNSRIMAWHNQAEFKAQSNMKSFFSSLNNISLFEVHDSKFDILQLYRQAMAESKQTFKVGNKLPLLETVEFITANNYYKIDYAEILPLMKRTPINEYLYQEAQRRDYSSSGLNRIRIETASACNLRCVYCPTGSDYDNPNVPKQIMQEAVFKQIIEQIKDEVSLTWATLYLGGEPLLNKNLVSYIKHLANSTHVKNIDFVTNGMLITKKLCHELAELSQVNCMVQISLDGRERGDNDRLRVGSNYKLIKENVYMMRKLLPSNFLVWVQNVQVGSETEIQGNPQVPAFLRQDFRELSTGAYGPFKLSTYFAQVWPGLNMTRMEEQGYKKKMVKEPQLCVHPLTEVSIRANGDVVPCCYDIASEYVLGNICQDNLSDILNSKQYRKLRNALFDYYRGDELRSIPDLCKKCVLTSGEVLFQ